VLVTDETDPYVDHWWPPGHVIGWEHTFVHENYEFLLGGRRGRRVRAVVRTGVQGAKLLDAVERADERGEWVSVE